MTEQTVSPGAGETMPQAAPDGDENVVKPRVIINPPVFFGASLLILLIVVYAGLMPDHADVLFRNLQDAVVDTAGWFYLLAVAVFLVFSLGLAFSSHGSIKLGPDDSLPEFRYGSWIAMLFSAGMGIGLMFFAVAEPLMHFADPPVGEGGTVEAAREAMALTFFHWGIHAWAIYAVVGLALAYFGYRHNLPLTIRSAFYPVFGNKIDGPLGHAVDIFAVLGTMFGVATSLGIGVTQVNAGLAYLLGVPESPQVQIMLIAAITLLATGSVVMGLNGGIRRVSELNLILAVGLLVFVLVAGPTVFLLQALVQNIGTYLGELVPRTFTLYAYEPNSWIGGWTLFYWGWWIAWAPFVGMFIARVSRGRTIREFIVGVLFVPVGFTFMWLTFFGNAAIDMAMNGTANDITTAVAENMPVALFAFFEHLPFTAIVSSVATVLVVTFFVTSSDSGSLVIDIITSGGNEDPPVWQRIFWAVTEGLVASVLLLVGGLGALQTATIVSALPFTLVMLVVCYGLLKGLRAEGVKRLALQMPASVMVAGADVPWQQRLGAMLSHPKRSKVNTFLTTVAQAALNDVAREMALRGVEAIVSVDPEDGAVALDVQHGEDGVFHYAVRPRGYVLPTFVVPEPQYTKTERARYYRAEVFLLEGGQGYDVMGYTRAQVIADVLAQYEKHLHFLHVTSV